MFSISLFGTFVTSYSKVVLYNTGIIALFIGGSDLKEGQWIWNEDFTPMTYTNWNKGEPRGGTRENCVALFGQNKYNGKWLDISCVASLQYLCKKNMVSF